MPRELRGVYDARVGHEGAPVADGEETFICQQWAWTGALDRYRSTPRRPRTGPTGAGAGRTRCSAVIGS